MSSNAFITQIKNQIDLHLGIDGKSPLNVDGEAFVVSLYGEWGIGKTHCLKALETLYQEALQATVKNDSAKSITIPVMFSPWRFEKEQHLIVPLVKTIQTQLEKLIEDDLRDDPNKPTIAGRIINAANWFGIFVASFTNGIKGKVGIPGVGEVEVDVSKMLDKAKSEAVLRDAEIEKAKAKHLPPKQESLYYDTLTWLKKLCQPSKENASQPALRFVLFIDDLDRCLPEKAVEMLESIKLFLDIPSFAFVIGVDNEVIERGIRHRYDAYLKLDANHLPITGHEYLEKIIHLPLMLPRMSEDQAWALLDTYRTRLIDCLPATESIESPDDSSNDKRCHAIFKLLLEIVPLVPRKLIRAIEGLLFKLALIKDEHGQRKDLSELFALRMIAIQQLYPDLYRVVKGNPQNWIRLMGVTSERGVLFIKDEAQGKPVSLLLLNAEVTRIENAQSDQIEQGLVNLSDEAPIATLAKKKSSPPIDESVQSDSLILLRQVLIAVQQGQHQRGANDPLNVIPQAKRDELKMHWQHRECYLGYTGQTEYGVVEFVFDGFGSEFHSTQWWSTVMNSIFANERTARELALLDLDLTDISMEGMTELLCQPCFDPEYPEYKKTLQDEGWWDSMSSKILRCQPEVVKEWNAAQAIRWGRHKLVSPRYQLEDDPDPAIAKEVRDLKTGLIWRRALEKKKFNFDNAQKHAKNVAAETRQAWRVPKIEELKTLVDKIELNCSKGLATIDHAAFPDTPEHVAWSSSAYSDYSDGAWDVYFYNGLDDGGRKSDALFVRLVRSSQ
jgi:KAP family P-loop domain/Protein of unknown function (DUF1566)